MIRTTKTKLIKDHLIKVGNISSLDAYKMYGATRLAAIIFVFRGRGMDIETKYENGKDKFGGNTTYARYYLKN